MKKQLTNNRYVAVGDLVVDCYYEEGRLLKIDGGASKFNVLCNLAARGNSTYVISNCGNDIYGQIAIKSLQTLGVDTSFVKQIGKATRAYHLIVENDRHISIKNCPICGKETWYEPSLVNFDNDLENLKKDDIVILDGLKPENLPMLKMPMQPKVLDIGRIKRLIPMSNIELCALLRHANLEILQLNETVAKYLYARFHLETPWQLFHIFKPHLLVVTKGKDGADFVTQRFIVNKKLLHYEKELDDTGAGDAFFSVIIQSYFENIHPIDLKWFDQTFCKANALTTKVVSHLGARGHLWDGYCSNRYNCICDM